MKGKHVKIRPVRREDLELLESWVNNVEVEGEFNDFGFKGHESMEGAFQKMGFTQDGIIRRAQWRHGDWHDLVLYSKLRGE